MLPVAQAKSAVDAIDIALQAHPWLAPLLFVGQTYALTRTVGVQSIQGGQFLPGMQPDRLMMISLAAFATALLGFKFIHTGNANFIGDGLKFLVGGDSSGLSNMISLIGRFYYTQWLSYPLLAAAVILLVPNYKPVATAALAAGLMLLPLLIAFGKKLTGSTAVTVAAAGPAPANVTSAANTSASS
jgi:hypothetical protein